MIGKFDRQFLRKVLSLPTASGEEQDVQYFIISFVEELNAGKKEKDEGYITLQEDSMGNLYATKGFPEVGGYYPTFVAHMDGALSHIPSKVVLTVPGKNRFVGYDTDKGQQCYLAADDLVGVYLALSALRTMDTLKCAFFVEEEVGCIGSSGCDIEFFDNSAYVLQSDRKGCHDVIYNAAGTVMASKEFRKVIRPVMDKYNMAFANGSVTDVMELKERGLDVCALNISSAYFDPHFASEYVDLDGVRNIQNFIGSMVAKLGQVRYQHKTTRAWGTQTGGGYGMYGSTYNPRTFADGYDDYYDAEWYNNHISSYDDYEEKVTRAEAMSEKFKKVSKFGSVQSVKQNLEERKAKHPYGVQECIDCAAPLDTYNRYLCPTCSQGYQDIGVYQPDKWPKVNGHNI